MLASLLGAGLSRHSTHATAHATAEHLPENVVKATPHAAEIHRRATTASSTHAAAKHGSHLFLLVVFTTGFWASDGLVGCLNILEFGFRSRIAFVAIGVVLTSQFAKGSLDFTVARIAMNTQDLVRIPVGHWLYDSRPSHINPPLGKENGVIKQAATVAYHRSALAARVAQAMVLLVSAQRLGLGRLREQVRAQRLGRQQQQQRAWAGV